MYYKYVATIPVYNRIYNFGIAENIFFLENIESKETLKWDTLELLGRPQDIEGYLPLTHGSSKRLFVITDESNTPWIVIETRHSIMIVNAPWYEILKHLRVNLDNLGDCDYYIRQTSLNYHFGIGNFYLYPELNPLKLPLKVQSKRVMKDILDTLKPIPFSEVGDKFPFGKMTRYRKGILINGENLWWFDKSNRSVYHLNSYFFEGAAEWTGDTEESPSDKSSFLARLPYDDGGEWISPLLDSAYLPSIINDTLELTPATGTRITPIAKASHLSAGQYRIAGYGDYGRYELPPKLITWIRTKLGTSLGISLRSEHLIGFYNISDIKCIYLRENPNWTAPVIKSPMVELDLSDTDELTDIVDPLEETIEIHIVDEDEHESIVDTTQLPSPPETITVAEQPTAEPDPVPVPDDAETPDALKQFAPMPVTEYRNRLRQLSGAVIDRDAFDPADMKQEELNLDFAAIHPADVNTNIEEYRNYPVITRFRHAVLPPKQLLNSVKHWNIQLPEPYGNLVLWKVLDNTKEHNAEIYAKLRSGDIISTARHTLLRHGDVVYVAKIHVNF